MTVKRIQRKRSPGWRKPENTMCVTRWRNDDIRFGNPFTVKEHGREESVRLFEDAIRNRDPIVQYHTENMDRLCGKNLACYCDFNGPCHADILLEAANC